MKYYYLKRHEGIFYYLKRGKRYYGFRFTYYDSSHKRHEKSSRGFNNQRRAIEQRDLVAQQHTKLNATGEITFGKWCKIFLSKMKPETKITTYKSYHNLLTHDVLPYLSNIALKDLKPMNYKANCLNKLAKRGLSRKTIIDINARVQRVLNSAVENEVLDKNRLAHTPINNGKQRPAKEIMNDQELSKFNNHLNHHSIQLQAIFYTLEETGLRVGELMGLHWKDLDLAHQLLHVRFTRDDYGLRTPKTIKSNRTVMITQHLRGILSKYHAQCKDNFNITPNSLVIMGKKGKPLIPNLVSAILRRLLIECGLKKMVGRFTPHSFRHMIVSRLINAGIKPTAVSKMMGHSSVAITLSIYAQSAPHEMINMDKAMKLINKKNLKKNN